jgi:predicted nucleic acid-binding protein
VRVFLDANVLFSMALVGPVFNAILEVAKRGRLHLLTSAFCYLEAWRNVLKVPERRQALEGILEWVRLVPEARPEPWMADLLPEKDVPVLAAAVAARATHLLTGDLRHFAPFRDPSSSISPLNGAITMGHFLLPRPIARRPAQESRSAARGVSTGVTSRRTGGRARQVGQAFAAHEPRPSDPGLVLASWVKGLSHSRSKDTPAVLSESTLEVK